jgi:predicted membrane chloride channel (bestrophin family)
MSSPFLKTKQGHHRNNVLRDSSFASSTTLNKRALKEVVFDAQSHRAILFQMYGSVWPKVLPFCLVNVAIAAGIFWTREGEAHIDLTFSDKGHTFMSLMVSFLVVSRASIVYTRYMEARKYLSDAMRSCRELVQHMAVLTLYESTREVRQWRYEVAYRTILLLRVLCAAIEFPSCGNNAWDIPEMDQSHRRQLMKCLILDQKDQDQVRSQRHGPRQNVLSDLAHGHRSLTDENFRVPVVMAYQLREAIMKNREIRSGGIFVHVNEELKIMEFVSQFNVAYHGLRKLITTPFPFPLVQMARTFLFVWVFTLPFALCGDILQPVQVCLIIFVITYGFIGLEYVSMELDDPFGDDPNDFDDLTMSQMVFEDIYITINQIDGRAAADKLRLKVKNKKAVGTDQESFVAGSQFLNAVFDEERSPLLNRMGQGNGTVSFGGPRK